MWEETKKKGFFPRNFFLLKEIFSWLKKLVLHIFTKISKQSFHKSYLSLSDKVWKINSNRKKANLEFRIFF